MPLDIARLAAGALLLTLGADWLVRGAAGLARALGVRPIVIGLTVVAYGTSAPELVVSLLAAVQGQSAIALGNVVGSNIANLGLILGLTALIRPPAVDGRLIAREVPVMIATALAIPIFLYGGAISRLEGALLVGGAIAFTLFTLRSSEEADDGDAAEALRVPEPETARAPGKAKLAGLVALGLAALLGGGKVLVDGATGLALALGMSERVVGLTIVAVGTSLPELATSAVAALRGHSSIAVGTIVGSNIFNVLLILGAAALARPIEGSIAQMKIDLAVLLAMTLAAALVLRGERVMTRAEGAVLACGYAIFLGALAMAG